MVTPFERPSVSELPFQRLLSLKYFSKVFILWKTFLRRLSLKPPFEDLVPPKSFLIILCLWKHSWMSSTSESPFNSLLSLKALLKNFVLRNPLSKHHVSERNFEGSCFLKKKNFLKVSSLWKNFWRSFVFQKLIWRPPVTERPFDSSLDGLLCLKTFLQILVSRNSLFDYLKDVLKVYCLENAFEVFCFKKCVLIVLWHWNPFVEGRLLLKNT